MILLDLDDINIVKKIISERLKESIQDMESKTRVMEVVLARMTAMVIFRELRPNVSLKSIGSYFGGRDHSTVIHAITTVGDLKDTNRTYNNLFCELLDECKIELDSEKIRQESILDFTKEKTPTTHDYPKNTTPTKNIDKR